MSRVNTNQLNLTQLNSSQIKHFNIRAKKSKSDRLKNFPISADVH